MTPRHSVFARMWAVGAVAHLAGNWRYGDVWPEPTLIGLVALATGLVATWLLIVPRRPTLLVLSVLLPVSAILEAPVLGNHWVLAAFVSLAYLLTAGDWDRFEPPARMMLLVFYGFAAFAKLNTGFLDPSVSCGVVYANEWLAGFGLSPIQPSSPLGWTAAWGSAATELAVPVLLMIPRTRRWGVFLAVGFHGLISLDLQQHFYDFTAVVLALFVLFLGDDFSQRFESFISRLSTLFKWLVGSVAVAVGVTVTLSSVLPIGSLSGWWLVRGSFLWWLPYLGLIALSLLASRARPIELGWRPSPMTAVVVALVFLNGLTPYLELKTAYGWNMYSNLVTVAGESNHLIVRSTVPVREGHDVLVEILESEDPALQVYADQGYLLPWPSFQSYLARQDRVSVTYRLADTTYHLEGSPESAIEFDVAWWWRWMPLRAVHAEQPDRCQTGFLPAL